MGVVYRARHKAFNVDRAFKLILTDNINLTLIERFEREARTLAELDHPHILRVYDYGSIHGSPYLVMDLIEGEDLESHLKSKTLVLDLDWLSERLTELASALEYCHEQGVAHRDFKPANVIIRRDTDQAVLIDFGLVKKDQTDSESLEALSKTGDLIGTPEYMAPEQFDTSGTYGEVGPKSDVWSFGVLLYYSLTGRKPFIGSSIFQFCKAVLKTKPDSILSINADAPEALVALTMDCLQKNGEKRPTMSEVISRIEQYREPVESGHRWLSLFLKVVVGLFLILALSVIAQKIMDTTPPEFDLNVPTKGLYGDKVSCSGVVFEGGCTVTLNGKALAVVDRQFQFELPLSRDGKSYKLEVRDFSGNSEVVTGNLERVREVQVGASESSEFATITEALEAVPEDIVIRVETGIYEEALILRSNHRIEALDLGKKVIIQAEKRHGIIVKAGTPWLRGLTVEAKGSWSDDEFHGIVVKSGTLTLKDCRIRSEGGNGILVAGSDARLMAFQCEINENNVVGVDVRKRAVAHLEHCDISENVKFNVRCESAELSLSDCEINGSKVEMGLFAAPNSVVDVKRCILKGNSCQGARAGSGARLTMEDCQILDTQPAPENVEGLYPFRGTGVYGYDKASISLKSCKISGNAGDGVWGNAGRNTIMLKDCEIFGNKMSGVELKTSGQKLELADCKVYKNGQHGLQLAGENNVSLKRVKSFRNQKHGFFFKESARVTAEDCDSSENTKGGGFGLNKDCVVVFRNCRAFRNFQSGFIILGKSRVEAVNCRSKENRRGLYGENSQIKWIGGLIRDNNKGGFSCLDKSSGLLKDIEISNNKNTDIRLIRGSRFRLIGSSGTRKQLKVDVDSSSKLEED